MDKLGIYFSIPFCRSKCTYCNFASGVFPAAYHERYIDRLTADLSEVGARANQWGAELPRAVDSVYLGGGTPSLLAPELLRKLFSALRRQFAVIPTAEITMECAPGQIADDVLAAMVECGVNRVSFGVQSFVDAEARSTGRLHTRETALHDIRRVRTAGIHNISVDLIAGLPGQTMQSWHESLGVLAAADVDHASIYMLEVDEESRLGREVLAGGDRYRAAAIPSDDLIAEMYSDAIAILAAAGLDQYEISNFAHRGRRSSHNLKYWTRQPYLGLGLDAHSMLRQRTGGAFRFGATDDLSAFLDSPRLDEPRRLAREEELEEAWFLGLRLNEGVSLAALRREFSAYAIQGSLTIVAELEQQGLLHFADGDRVALTPRGRLLSNEVFARFLAEPATA